MHALPRFVLARSLRDPSIMARDGLLDGASLAYRLLLRDNSRCNLFLDVGMVESPSAARQFGTVVLRDLGTCTASVRGNYHLTMICAKMVPNCNYPNA